MDRLADAEVITVNFNVLHDPTSTSTITSKAHSSAPSSSSSSSSSYSSAPGGGGGVGAAVGQNSSSSSSSTMSPGKIPPPLILNTASYLNKMKQRTPTEGKGWMVNSDEMQGESGGNVKEIEKLDSGNSNSTVKQGVKASEDLSSGAQSKKGVGEAVKEASI